MISLLCHPLKLLLTIKKARYEKKFFTYSPTRDGFLISGCSESHATPFLGYWLQDAERRPVSLHIKEDGQDVMVRIGQLSFGKYQFDNALGQVKQEGLLNIGNQKQLRYVDGNLIDVDDESAVFKRINEQEYKAAIEK